MIFMLKKYKVILFASFIGAATLLTSCVQTTKSMFGEDRNQLLLVSEAELNKEAQSSYNQVLSEARSKGILNTDEVNRARVNGVSQRLIAVVYTGLIKTLNLNDDELASIVGHEISHALKEHSREKMSKVMVQDTVSSILSLLGISKTVTDTANLAYNAAFAMPFSRDQESEADKYGLELMYKAGFDPNACVTVMQKMDAYEKQASAEAGVSKSESFLNSIASTHPSSEKRYKDLKELIERFNLNNK